MKWGIIGIVVLFAGTVVMASFASSCAVNHRSGDYACAKQSDCNDGRQCVDGFCIIPGSIDAPGPMKDARAGDSNNCPSPCTSCNMAAHSCTIDCSAGANCNDKVVCPAGLSCNVLCNTGDSCRNGVTCTGTTSCAISCSAQGSCEGIVCGTGKCAVDCTGVQSCKNVSCGSSCACDVNCIGSQSCPSGIQCTATACKLGLGCSSLGPTCHSC